MCFHTRHHIRTSWCRTARRPSQQTNSNMKTKDHKGETHTLLLVVLPKLQPPRFSMYLGVCTEPEILRVGAAARYVQPQILTWSLCSVCSVCRVCRCVHVCAVWAVCAVCAVCACVCSVGSVHSVRGVGSVRSVRGVCSVSVCVHTKSTNTHT